MIKEAIAQLVKREDLTSEVMEQVMEEIMTGEATDAQKASFLTALSMKGETIDEITSAAKVLRSHCERFLNDMDVLEIVGTGGDGSNTINISTLSSVVVSAAGIPVAKHGNRAASSKCGTADCLEALGVKIDCAPARSAQILKDINLCFLFAQKYHPAMRFVGAVRKEMGIRTLFNVLGPLANPAGATMQLFGVYSEELVEPLAHVLRNLGVKRAMVVYGRDSMDEISLSAETKVCEFKNDEFKSYVIKPEDLGLTRCNKEDLVGGTPQENAAIVNDILGGAKGPKTDVVLLNAGAAIYLASDGITLKDGIEKAREIIDEALKTAENKKRESLLEVKEESIRTKNELDKEIKERRAEAQRYERRVQQKEENIDKKADAIEKREASLASREESLNRMKEEVSRLNEQRVQELERISGLTSEQAKDYLLKIVEDEVKHESAVMIKEMESRAKEEADKKAKEYVVNAIQRCAADHVSETTISVVQLPNDEMKGRIIGREGRNIRTLETMTGVDLIIDDTPEAVILSGFDPIRREVARIALEKLIVDGRIHPARIEEMVEKAQKEVEVMIKEEGEAATLEVGVHGIHPELVRLLGKMKFRTSYGQNALKHSIEVAQLSGLLAAELGLDVRLAKRAGLLHDIGKAVDHEMEGSHIQLGAELCRKYKESATVINAVESHHGDVEPTSLIACIVQAADTISAARPGARRETLETYTSRLKQLEDISNNFKGVDKSGGQRGSGYGSS